MVTTEADGERLVLRFGLSDAEALLGGLKLALRAARAAPRGGGAEPPSAADPTAEDFLATSLQVGSSDNGSCSIVFEAGDGRETSVTLTPSAAEGLFDLLCVLYADATREGGVGH